MISNERFMKQLDSELYSETGIRCAYEKYCGALTLEDIYTTDSVYIAAHYAASGFMNKPDTRKFMKSAWLNSMKLAEKVLTGKFSPVYYSEKMIMERGKERVIKPPAFECKVVQKVMCNYLLRPLFEPKMIKTNYASIRGKGTEAAYDGILKSLNSHGHDGDFIILTDYSGYFASIDNCILEDIMRRYVRDDRIVDLFRMFGPDDFGLSLGNETSQVPASFFPSSIDHILKDRLGCRDVHRYMDDTFILAHSEKDVNMYLNAMHEEADRLHLNMSDKKTTIIPYGTGFVFCKERFIFNKEKKYYYRLINPKIVSNEIRKIKRFKIKVDNGEMTMDAVNAQVEGVLGMIKGRPNTRKAVKRIETEYDKNFKQT